MTQSSNRQLEKHVQARVLVALGAQPDFVVWRNNTGALHALGAAGRVRPMRFGLAVGSADLVGVLRPSGRFVAIEVKTSTGRLRPAQAQWSRLVQSMGGFYAVVRSADDAIAALARARAGEVG